MSKELNERLQQIDEMTDERLIVETFKDDPNGSVHLAVVDKLTDQNLIFNTFKNDPHYFVRKKVVEKLSDEQLIFDTFKDDPDSLVREAVVHKRKDYLVVFFCLAKVNLSICLSRASAVNCLFLRGKMYSLWLSDLNLALIQMTFPSSSSLSNISKASGICKIFRM